MTYYLKINLDIVNTIVVKLQSLKYETIAEPRENCHGLLIFLDMSAAFDTLKHAQLIKVLVEEYAIEVGALEWFTSYPI